MIRRPLLLLAVVGCADSELSDARAPADECPPRSFGLTVEPRVLRRGEAADIAIVWLLGGEVEGPVVATLATYAEPVVEVDVPLARIGAGTDPSLGEAEWRARQLNPFGVGTPAGEVSVLARSGTAPGCGLGATAATSFELTE